MAKKIENDPKKSEDLKQLLKKNSNEINKLKENINSLECKFKKIKKHNYWIPIGVAIFSAVMLSASFLVSYYDASGGFIQKPEINGYELINKHSNTTEEAYRIWLHNTGDITAKDITIKIEFPFENTTITDIFKHSEEIIIDESEFGGVGSYKYGLKYSEILVGEHVNLTVIVDIADLEKDKNDILWPDAKVWIGDNPPITLEIKNNTFYY